ncbi:hypothetical protein M5X11_16045 [Paenibacillus alginolyticus]|uniref:hypothetical protein n=1 Tax=Paenibacillus alginolyticus TaxID=59839 RepID=UPI000418CA44|nr:hypothetical protein [Paenibacillus alginolyticus]MCY9666456.1 hypothetical protein [Paenibacillus alginolyticus]
MAFQLGYLYVTPEAAEAVGETEINQLLEQYMQGNWGTVSAEEWQRNDQALILNEDLHAIYNTSYGKTLQIITKWDRSRTVVLLALPNEDDNPITSEIKSFLDEEDLESAIAHIREENRSNSVTTEEAAFVADVERGTGELTHTEREQTIRSRVGQSLFKVKLLRRTQRCELCGLSTPGC